MNPVSVGEHVLGFYVTKAMRDARISWPAICREIALELFLNEHKFDSNDFEVYRASIRAELKRLGY